MMERPLSLEVLPIVIIDHVASYLSIDDINACCATSSKMREAFSDNLIWKRRCDVKRINYLKRSDCRVKPGFEWDDDKWINLSPVSEWRKNYMMQAHLFKHWRRYFGFEKRELEFGPDNVEYSLANIEFYENDFLFLHTYLINENKHFVDIWDVVDDPFLHSTLNLNFDQFDELDRVDELGRLDLYKIVDNKLVVGLGNLILVYNIALCSSSYVPLDHAFLFDMSEKCSKDIITHDEKKFKSKTGFELAPHVELIVFGSYLVGAVANFKDLPSPTFHVWSIDTGKKIEEVMVPAANLNVVGLQFLSCDDGKNIVVQLKVSQNRYTCHCYGYGYDLSKRSFTSFLVKVNYCDFSIFKNKYVIGAAGENLFVYCYETSRKLLVKKCAHNILLNSLNVVGDCLLFGTWENIVYVLDLNTMHTINKVKLRICLYSLRAICDKFVVVNGREFYSSLISEVWEIGKKTAKKWFEFPVHRIFLTVNQHCTKVAIVKKNKIRIIHFW